MVRFGSGTESGDAGGTGIALYNGALYAETNDRIVRYLLPAGNIAPSGAPDVIVSGLPLTGDHPMHPFRIDADGSFYVDLGSATNACQGENRIPQSRGIEPCTELETRAGTWRYDANRTGQASRLPSVSLPACATEKGSHSILLGGFLRPSTVAINCGRTGRSSIRPIKGPMSRPRS
jgi:hypothetical protein